MVIKGLSESMILVAEVRGRTRPSLTMNLSSNLPVKTSQSDSESLLLLVIVIAPIKIKVEGYFTLSTTCGNNDLDVFRV